MTLRLRHTQNNFHPTGTEFTNENNFTLFPLRHNLQPTSNNKRSSQKDKSGENEIKMKIRKGAAQGSGKLLDNYLNFHRFFSSSCVQLHAEL